MDQTKYVYSIDDKGRVYPNYKFHDPGAGILAKWVWPYNLYSKRNNFLKIFFFTPRHRPDKTLYIVMITNEGSNKMVTLMDPGQGVAM